MLKIAAYIAAWKLQRLVAERKAQQERRAVIDFVPVPDYGDNGTEGAFYLLTDNFR